MDTVKYIDILEKKKTILQNETEELKSIIEDYPYFQSARALYLKGLKNLNSFNYNKELKITAAYTTDRTLLFNYITSNDFIALNNTIASPVLDTKEEIDVADVAEVVEEIKPQIEVTPEKEEPKVLKNDVKESFLDVIIDTKIESIPESINEAEEKLEIGKPITFTSSENHSFIQWLHLAEKKPIAREEKPKKAEKKKEHIIEKFILNKPKIERLSKDKNVTISVSKNQQDSSLMTETLAKVYLEQKKYENAIQAYRILSLKYPEKSGFFADQIKRIQILQKHKS